MLKRFLTSIVIVAVTIGFFALRYVSPYIFDLYLGAIIVLATYEVSRAYKKNQKKSDLYFILSYPVVLYFVLILSILYKLNLLIFVAIMLALLVVIFVASLLLNIFSKNKMNKEMLEVDYIGSYKKYALKKSVTNLFIMVYPALVLFFMLVINHLSSFSNFVGIDNKNIEVFLLIMAFVTTMLTDTGAYIIGSGLGGKKLCPKISPNKTYAGAIGGVVLSMATSVLLFILFSLMGYASVFESYSVNIVHFIVYGFIASIFTQLGDILASYVKRKNDIKDFSNLLPGHGGVLDRVDGLMFNSFITLVLSLFIFL